MSGKEQVVVNKIYEYVPPDGGWGYMIWISAIIIYSTTTMFLGCFGLLFKNFLIELEMGSFLVTLMMGTNAMSVAICGFLTDPLLKAIGLRKLAFLSATVFNVGAVWTIFVNSIVSFFFCQTIQFAGFGILYALACTQINEYFVKKRLLAISFVQTMSALAAMVAPLLVNWSLESFGFRGTLIMIACVSAQVFIAVALMQPVEKHLIRVEVQGKGEEMKLLVPEKKVNEKVTTPTITLTESQRSFDAKNPVKSDNQEKNDVENNKVGNMKCIANGIIDLPLMKRYLLSASSMGPTYSVFAESLFVLMLPQALYKEKWSEDLVAKALTLSCFGDLATRIFLIMFSNWLNKIGSNEIFLIGLLISVISKLGMLWSEDQTIVLVFITIMGISRCTTAVLPPLILADSYRPEQFTSAMGTYMLFMGLMTLSLGPAIGAVRDMTDSYPTVFYILTSCFSVVILLWCIELIYKRNKHKRVLQLELAAKLKKQKNKANK